MFVNTIPVRINMPENGTFIELAKYIATNIRGVLKHQKYSYMQILEDMRSKNPSISNLYNVLISYQITKAFSNEYGDYETLKIWEKFNKREYPYIKIHYLAPDMCAKSTEIYTKPQVSFIQFEQDDYKVDDIKKYTLVMQYETISNNESNN